MQLDWSRVMEFILQQDPGLAASFVGVERSRIAAVEAQYGITLPTTYVDFLATMGEERFFSVAEHLRSYCPQPATVFCA